MTIEVEAGDVDRLAALLAEVGEDAPAESRKVVSRGALQIKQDAQQRVQGLQHAPYYPRSISYDTKQTATGAEAEVGPDKHRRQGPLGNLIEFGSINNPPRPHIIPAGEAELPKFEKAMGDLGVRMLEGS
ncbi:hypothetical protein ACFP2T_16470 [Plantactinospora solaniradicis]|uniref:HK97 gp10 family phage protein n=1 Tax=Plantactinospora solaniradicis TaxID=1723736 RepID=A0ABW1K957_9ACTN